MTARKVSTVETATPRGVVVSVPVVLERSYDRKVSGAVRRQRSKDAALVGNSLGFLAGPSATCQRWPVDLVGLEGEGLISSSERATLEAFYGSSVAHAGGATEACRSCYAANLETAFPAVGRLIGRNTEKVTALEAAGDVIALTEALGGVLDSHYLEACKRSERDGLPLERLAPFRAHWDGDFVGPNYARAMVAAWRDRPHVPGWLYSRQPVALLILSRAIGLEHVALYYSADRYNAAEVDAWLGVLGERVHVAALSDSHAAAVDLAAGLGRVARACPETAKRFDLVMPSSGRAADVLEVGETGQGACSACRLCIDGRGSVAFSTVKGKA